MMKRAAPLVLAALLGVSACETGGNEDPLGPEVPDPFQGKASSALLSLPSECSSCLLPPTILARTSQAPAEAAVAFSAAAGQGGELVVQAADPSQTTVKVWLNGTVALLPSAFPQARSKEIRIPVVLAESNILEVRLSSKPGTVIAFWVVSTAPVEQEPLLWTGVGLAPTGNPAAPLVVADDQGLALLLLTDPDSGTPRGASTFLAGLDGPGLVRFDDSGIPAAAFLGGGVAYFANWSVGPGGATVSVTVPPGGSLPETTLLIALPSWFVPVVEGLLGSAGTAGPSVLDATAWLQGLSNREALAAQVAWCALEVAGVIPPSAGACRTTLLEGVPRFWGQWTEAVGYEPFLSTVTGSLGLTGCLAGECVTQAWALTEIALARVTPGAISVLAGDGQSGTVGEPLADLIQVLVTNGMGEPLPGFLANFTVTLGGGLLAGTQATLSLPTNGEGAAGASWTLGSLVGEQAVGVSTIAFQELEITFTGTAREPMPVNVFRVTKAVVAPSGNMNAACTAEFGSGFAIADWTDVAAAVAGGAAKGEIMDEGVAMILNNGAGAFTPMFQFTTHHYMISTFGAVTSNLGSIPPDLFWLTEGTTSQPVLCLGPSS